MDQKNAWVNGSSYTTPNAFIYYGVNGQLLHANAAQKTEGGGFKVGDLVEMEVDLQKGELKWYVN